MFKIMKKIYKMGGKLKGKYVASIILSFFESSAANVPLGMILVGLYAILDDKLTPQLCLYLFIGLVVGIVLRAIFKYLVYSRQQGTGYIIFADVRKNMAERLKRYPMG